MEKYKYYYKIADLLINIRIPHEIIIGKESKDFIYERIDEKKVDISIEFKKIDFPMDIKGNIIFEKLTKIYKTEEGFIHEFYNLPKGEPYGWLIKLNENNYEFKYLEKNERYIKYSRSVLQVMSLESLLNQKNTFILHTSFIKWREKGILFSAPSGIGKSTQADLWNKYENAEIINGDRAAIRNINGKFRAYGLPYAGSSKIFKNKSAIISHIIVLRQGKKNILKKLSPRDAFIQIYSQTTIHNWDEEYKNRAIDDIIKLVGNIPIYLYECLPDKSAVDVLKLVIEEDLNCEES